MDQTLVLRWFTDGDKMNQMMFECYTSLTRSNTKVMSWMINQNEVKTMVLYNMDELINKLVNIQAYISCFILSNHQK